MTESLPQPFAELPAGLVAELLSQAESAGDSMLAGFRELRGSRETLREGLRDAGLIMHDSDVGYPPEPSTCGTDGSYGIERLLTADFVACAAVAVEGLTPPKEDRFWPEPRHNTYVGIEPHDDETTTVLRSIMTGRELLLAHEAPHDLVMIDGSMALPLIYLNQAINSTVSSPQREIARVFLSEVEAYLAAYREVLRTLRTDKQFLALPKYTTRREIGATMGWSQQQDDRGMLTQLLEPGDFTRPRLMDHPTDAEGKVTWHLNAGRIRGDRRAALVALAEEVVSALSSVYITYYKPQRWLPAFRVEMSKDTATNSARLAIVLRGLKHQCATSAMLEPYPIYLADRTVKALARALPAFRHIATQIVSEKYEGDIAEVFFAMHGYRSESGV